ncbi:MAG TPA: ABC transporter substrate-binding protein [Bacillales bacterium]|nr:ABC transporter substrate-binding protein [Bacillales bacterium]
MNRKMKPILFSLLVIPLLVLSACGSQNSSGKDVGKIVFADPQWSSVELHNWIARTILEEGYGYETDVKTGSTASTFLAFRQGDIDVYMEIWPLNIQDIYNKAIENGEIKQVSVNYSDARQGIFVPTYMLKGDPDRGIEPMAPDLKSVKDLPKYWELFKDPSNPEKGRIIGSPTGWEADKVLRQKIKAYGLDKTYNYFSPGSQTALFTSLKKAYEAGEPWVGYMWGPTWVLGKYDMTLLQEPPFSEEVWKKSKACAWPQEEVSVAVNMEFADKAPEVVDFLSNYHTSADLTNAALSYMEENEAKPKDAAQWWLKKYKDIWTKWVPKDVAKKVEQSLQ